MEPIIRDLTESGDFYKAPRSKWVEYRKAWEEGDMDQVEFMERGGDPAFEYDQD